MNQSAEIKELAKALVSAQGEMKMAEKSAQNPFFKSNYADLPAVIESTRPALTKNGLSVVQSTDLTEKGDFVLVTLLLHVSGQWIGGVYPLRPQKADPQGYGSAITYARRYAYQAMVCGASADDDDDGNAATGHPQSAASNGRSAAPPMRLPSVGEVIRQVGTVPPTADPVKRAGAMVTPEQVETLQKLTHDMNPAQVAQRLKSYGVSSFLGLSKFEATGIIDKLLVAQKGT